MHQLRRVGRTSLLLGVVLLLARCGGSDIVLPSESIPASITKEGGDQQQAPAGNALPLPVVVKVVDQLGAPLANQRVAFDPGEGAEARPERATTDSKGLATAEWVLAPTSGPQSMVASVVEADDLEVAFDATAQAGAAHRIEAVGGNQQDGTVGSVLPEPLVVLVTDEFGNPVEGVTIAWSAEDGAVDPASSTTGSDGKASTSWQLASATGDQSASAASEGLDGSPVAFTATAAPGGATRLILVSGDKQSGKPGQELPEPLVVRLQDADGNGVSGRPVSWVIGSGGGDVSATTSTTDGKGQAQVRWTLGQNPGLNTVNAVVSGVGFVAFTATAKAPDDGNVGGGGDGGSSGGGIGGGGGGGGSGPVPSRLQFRVQPSDGERDQVIDPPVQVAVLDQNGNPVTQAEFQIKLELLGDKGNLKGHDRENTRSGVATFADLKVDKEGEYRLRATAAGFPAVESAAFEIHERSGKDDDGGRGHGGEH